MAVNGLYCRGLGANLAMGNEGLFARGLFGTGAGVDGFDDPPRFRDATFRRRYGGLFGLVLLAGAVQGIRNDDPHVGPQSAEPVGVGVQRVHADGRVVGVLGGDQLFPVREAASEPQRGDEQRVFHAGNGSGADMSDTMPAHKSA